MSNWAGKQVLIIGAARQGTALALYLLRQGARIVMNDRRSAAELAEVMQALSGWGAAITWVVGSHPLEVLDGVACVFISGGVPLTLPLVQAAQQRGILLSNDSQVFMEVAPCKIIGITGSAGKTTTTSLVGSMAVESAARYQPGGIKQAWVGGNIGNPLIAVVDEMQPDDLAVMELSSFQLEIMTCAPAVAAVLNITPNHLDRHESMEAYTQAKARIIDYQPLDSAAVLGRDDPGAWALAGCVRTRRLSFGLSALPPHEEGGYLQAGQVRVRHKQTDGAWLDESLLPQAEIQLRGEHNLLNVLAACTIGVAAGLPPDAMRAAVQRFRGVPHRLELVRSWRGSQWYNDSIATAPERVLAALRSFDEPLVLLAGGRDKNLPWEDFAALAVQRLDHLVLFGEAAEKIERAISQAQAAANSQCLTSVQRCSGLQSAVLAAAAVVKPGSVVLLSPGCTSFDEFQDFEERGKCFVQWVNELD